MNKENTIKFMEHIIETGGNPSSKVAKDLGLSGYFNELCMRGATGEELVKRAKYCLDNVDKWSKRYK